MSCLFKRNIYKRNIYLQVAAYDPNMKKFLKIQRDNELRGDFMLALGRRDEKLILESLGKWWSNVTGKAQDKGDYKVGLFGLVWFGL